MVEVVVPCARGALAACRVRGEGERTVAGGAVEEPIGGDDPRVVAHVPCLLARGAARILLQNPRTVQETEARFQHAVFDRPALGCGEGLIAKEQALIAHGAEDDGLVLERPPLDRLERLQRKLLRTYRWRVGREEVEKVAELDQQVLLGLMLGLDHGLPGERAQARLDGRAALGLAPHHSRELWVLVRRAEGQRERVALDDGAVEEVRRVGHGEVRGDRHAARRLAKDGDGVRIAAKLGDVRARPLQRQPLVQEPKVAGELALVVVVARAQESEGA